METVKAAHRPARKTLMAMVDDHAIRLPIRVAIQPRLMTGLTGARKYKWWRGTHWTFEAATLDDLAAFRRCLMAFFDLIDEIGNADAAEAVLRAAQKKLPKRPIKRLVRKAVPEHLTPAKLRALQEQQKKAPKLDVF